MEKPTALLAANTEKSKEKTETKVWLFNSFENPRDLFDTPAIYAFQSVNNFEGQFRKSKKITFHEEKTWQRTQ